MTRYFYYLIALNMLANIILFVPRTLISDRFDSSMMSSLLSIPIGYMLIRSFVKALAHFPQQGIPEILAQWAPGWIRIVVLVPLIFMWFSAGSLSLISYGQITTRYINPDVSSLLIILSFVAVVALIARLSSETVLYSMEILLMLSMPFIIWLFVKSLATRTLAFDAGFEVMTHLFHMPSWETFSASTYIFTGYVNMAIFNRLFQVNPRYLWLVPLCGAGVLLTSFLIPVGFQGTMAVGDFVYPWVATSDSMRIEFGIVERVLFIFLLLYMTISITGTFIHWHVCLEFCKSLLPRQSARASFSWIIVGLFSAVTVTVSFYLNDESLYQLGVKWLVLRLGMEFALVLLIIALARRKQRQ